MAPPFDNQYQQVYNPYGYHTGQPSPIFSTTQMPMFGSGQPPRFTGPFNFNTGMGQSGMGAMMQMFMPLMVSQMSSSGRIPAQFFPEQGFYEQLRTQQFFIANQQAAQMASQSDISAMNRTFGGITMAMTGKPLTPQEKIRNMSLAQGTSQMMPILTQFLGPDMVDALHGSRGSAQIFASQLHSAMRTSRDPLTGAIGMSGASAGRVGQGVYENLFGANYNPATLRGMSAGQAGILAQELQNRGLLGVPIGSMGIGERRAAIPETLSDETFRRIARSTKQITDLGEGNATGAQLDAATQRVRDTHARLRNEPRVFTEADIMNEDVLPGGADIMRTADSARITNRLKDMSGAVKAMREIFGDMGNPNAPMREIVDGLNKLTQGGLSTLSPGKLEATVRQTQAIAKNTGMSIEGIMALTDTNAQLGDQLGLNRKYAVTNAQQNALFGSAAINALHLGSGIFGQGTAEQFVAADAQLRTHATASPAANQMRLAARMQREGLIQNASPKLKAYMEAMSRGDVNFDFRMHDADYLKMMEESGVDRGTTTNLLWDVSGNQAFGDELNIPGLIRGRSLRTDAINRTYAPAVQSALALSTGAGRKALIDSGAVGRNVNMNKMLSGIGVGFMEGYFAMDAATYNNDKDRKEAMKGILRTQITENLAKAMPGKGAAEVAAAAETFINANGGLDRMATNVTAGISRGANEDVNAKTAARAFGLYGRATEKDMLKGNRQSTYDARMAAAFGGLGTAGPLARLIDTLQDPNAIDGLSQDNIMAVLGAVKQEDMEFADPQGPLMVSLGLMAANQKLNIENDADYATFNRNADLAEALNLGGDYAQRLLDSGTITDPKILKLLNEAVANPNMLERAIEASPELGKHRTASTRLNAMLADPNRSTAVHGAAVARKKLLQLGVDKGVFGADKKSIEDLTAADMASVDEKLTAKMTTGAEKEQLKKLQAESALLKGLDTAPGGLSLDDLQRAVDAVAPAAEGAAAKGNETVRLDVTGTFTEEGTGRVLSVTGNAVALARSLIASAVS